LQTFRLYKGTKEEVQTQKRKAELEIEDGLLGVVAPIMTALRARDAAPITASANNYVNETVAGSSTYKAVFEIPFNQGGGHYYATLDMNAVSALAGFTTAPTSMTTNVGIMLVDEGEPLGMRMGPKGKMILDEDKARVAAYVNPTNFSIGGVREVCIMCASELSTVLNSLSFDENFTSYAMKYAEMITARQSQKSLPQVAATTLPSKLTMGNPTSVATALYALYQTADTPLDLNAKVSGSATFYYFWYQ
jgi:hypothetical protein